MSRYTNLRVVDPQITLAQGADTAELERNMAVALASISPFRVITGIEVSGSGQGHSFTVSIEHGYGEGYPAALIRLSAYMAEVPSELQARYAGAVAWAVPLWVQIDAISMGASDGRVSGGVVVFLDATYHAPVNQFLLAANYYIDAVNGSDLNLGTTSGTALASWAELARRWGPHPQVSSVITVNILSDLNEVLGLGIDPIFMDSTSGIVFTASPKTVEFNGTVLVHVPAVAGTEGTLTDNAPAPIADWTPYIGKRIRVTEAGGTNFFCTFVGGLGTAGAGTAQVGVLTRWIGTGRSNIVCTGSLNPGDTYNIETLFSVRGVSLTCSQFSLGSGTYTEFLGLVVENLAVNGIYGATGEAIQVTGVLRPAFISCAIYSDMEGDAVSLYGCALAQNTTAGNLFACIITGMDVLMNANSGGNPYFSDCVVAMAVENQFEGETVSFVNGTVSNGTLNFGVWHGTDGAGVYVDQSSSIRTGQVIGYLSNGGASCYGWRVNGSVWYTTQPAAPTDIAGKDYAIIGGNVGAPVTYAAWPAGGAIEVLNNAMIVVGV